MHIHLSKSGLSNQRGAVLMVMLIIMIVGLSAFFISSLNSSALRLKHNQDSAKVLAQAKEALIGYAIAYGDNNPGYSHGYLPCPDVNETGILPEGVEHGNCGLTNVNTLGRFPWKSLGLPTLSGGDGECLWYAVSGTYKNNPKSGTAMNWDNTGKLRVFSAAGTEFAANEIVAVIIAPGAVIPGNNPAQNRAATTAVPLCGGNYTPSAYLDNDTIHNINNSDIATGKFILPHEDRDANGNVISNVNDQFVYITRQDIWAGVQKRIAKVVKRCLDDYASSSGQYPWASPVSDTTSYLSTPNTFFGRVPTPDGPPPSPPSPPSSTVSQLLTLQTNLNLVQGALANYVANPNPANTSNLYNAALALIAQSKPPNPFTTANGAADIAGDRARDLTLGLTNLSTVNNSISTADSSISTALTNAGYTPPAPPLFDVSSIPSCSILSSPVWTSWRDLVFYQVANGYQPGGSVSCTPSTTCLTINGSGNTAPGNGTYYAAIVFADHPIGTQAPRTNTNSASYLEGANLHTGASPSTVFETYNSSDANYSTVNDHVLCLDGNLNCN